ncbi:class I SAM-dependent methyltransferase [Aureimonas sp. SK2]|uniref:class I SAM-dependent methyltransferase n=1 Tax=Aureimonas sp. SK2 TaxID=3015992 RepID=UPI002443AA30|nr:class I SAM-dependent methyltransferase [Aureimonas sp. SK2]
MSLLPYDNVARRLVALQCHRDTAGGNVSEIGALQRDHLVADGLRPSDKLVDFGCDSPGVKIALSSYLNSGNIYGIDYIAALLADGYDPTPSYHALTGRPKLRNVGNERNFLSPFEGVLFDAALARDVFTHLPINHLRLCLASLHPRMRTGGRFYCSLFIAQDDVDFSASIRQPPHGEVETFSYCDPFHVWERDIHFAMEGLAWRLDGIHSWNHPRGQQMAHFVAV